ncbi:MAG: hypothetical protein LC687_08120, partial [Actinobacteria bacterium]|nr:hypothetical protein [Actinomycetota bacterium]
VYTNPNKGIDVIDAATGTEVTITPQFELGRAERSNNRIFYDLKDNDGIKVVSLGASGYKEDIVLKRYQGKKLRFDYDLTVPEGVEARLETDGSVGFYGVEDVLLSNVTAASEEDEALLEKARQNGQKTSLLFRIPAPVVYELDRQKSVADVYYELDGNTLSTVATNLKQANYPISIDPSVYVESARKFLRGNEETNVDFDVDNELIQKGTTTGARFNNWNSTMPLNDGRFDGGSVVAGGYAYYVGGVSGTADETVSTFTTSGTDTWDVPAGVTSVSVELWGAGGGGGGGSSSSSGGAGGGGGYTAATIPVTPAETITIEVGGSGGAGDRSSGGSGTLSGDGGGGGGHSEVRRGGTSLAIAPGGGGGGGGDNSSA